MRGDGDTSFNRHFGDGSGERKLPA
jgi:hypothetical protein